jgi:hypothetical protein
MGAREIIESFRQAREEQVRFFSNAAKPERERRERISHTTVLGLR